jgi:hypothetical protein
LVRRTHSRLRATFLQILQHHLQFRDRHRREGRDICGLTVEEYINRLVQDLIPLAERCSRVMREALAALETLRAGPSPAVERSKPIAISVMFGSRPL